MNEHPTSTCLALALTLASLSLAGCSMSPVIAPDGAILSPDAGGSDAERAGELDTGSDAAHSADASVPPDADHDAGPLAGCFEAPTRVRVSHARPDDRAHMEIYGAVGFDDGWAIITWGARDGETLLVLDLEGRVLSETPLGLSGWAIHAEGRVIFLLSMYWVRRVDVDASGAVRAYADDFVGGVRPRHEGIRAFEPLPGGGFRVLTHFYDETARRSILRLSEIERDDGAETGLRQRTSDLADFDGPDPFYGARYFLAGDHLRVLGSSPPFRVMDVQIGLATLGSDAVLGVRVWSDQEWPDAPDAVVALTRDRTRALTMRTDPTLGPRLAHLEPVPPATGPRVLLEDGLDLGYGTIGASLLDLEDGRLVVATYDGLHLFEGGDGARLTETAGLIARANADLSTMRRGDDVAVAFVEPDNGGVSLRCLHLPAR